MTLITKTLEFDYGHRVLGHEGKCANLHGHRGKVTIAVSAPRLDAVGRVIDFSIIKQRVGGWIDEHWDHNLLLHPSDPLLKLSQDQIKEVVGRDPFTLRLGNPTAENMAEVLFNVAQMLLPELQVISVEFHETPTCSAIYSQE
jgi:6-pyruvoyltetrahydropterin/6-carboxytetrahydropterin synthase